mmetsp:Transcript_94580/g.267731  ORF Transcript_94580/g.267731 Transcript_94580/m.267731 type:complete len:240 (-) Transcript_94580:239-958(-)
MAEDLEAKMKKVHWVPLESNPDMLTTFARKAGMPDGYEYVDVFGFDAELLMMVPRPCLAVTLLFQCNEKTKAAKQAQHDHVAAAGQKLGSLRYIKQFVGNACGTIACIHSLANNASAMGLSADSPIGKFLAAIEGKTPEEAGKLLVDATDLHSASESSASGGQTAAPEATANTDHHFIVFVEKDGDVYELDGGKAFPINHGPTGGDLMAAAAQAIKTNFVEKDPENIHFNMMALVKAQD